MGLPEDTVMSLDMGVKDCFYRIRRSRTDTKPVVVYVHLRDLEILDETSRTYGPSTVKALRLAVDAWNERWTTLTVFKENGQVQSTKDAWKPQFLDPDTPLIRELPRWNVVDLDVKHVFKNRVHLVQIGSERLIFKFCPFEYEPPYFTQEVKAFTTLSNRGCSLIPKLQAYVFERSEEEVVGFVCEELEGRFAEPEDYNQCRNALLELHSHGCIHGDVNKFNVIVTEQGPRFIDLEKSRLDTDLPADEFRALQQQELDGLSDALDNKEGWGKPWLVEES